ncbi:MAG TPA: hypothetical protein VFC82_00855 [Actinomycetaceae bacterium]|nr:hypothetical protein [Actinomycetaceae bacterium]
MTSDDSFLDKHTFLGDGRPDTLDQRLARELPEDAGEDVPFERQPDAVGELVAEPHEGESVEVFEEQDVLAFEAGPAREGAPAEQTAMHVMDADFEPDEDYSAFVSHAENEGDEDGEDERDDDRDDEGADEDESGGGEADERRERPTIGRDDSSDEFVFDSEHDDDRVSRYDA